MIDIIYRYDPSRPAERDEPKTAAAAVRVLEKGNAHFASLGTLKADEARVIYFNLEDIGVPLEGEVLPQEPYAAVLGCSDARVPTELIFDRTCNELFVVRVAGNVLGAEQLGSIDYAVENLSHLRLLVVLGHSKCGAVTAAVDAFLQPASYLELLASHHVRTIINGIFPAVRGAATTMAAVWGDDVVKAPGYRDALIEASIVLNAALTASVLQEEFGKTKKDLRIVFGVYEMSTRRVHVPSGDGEGCLRNAPATRDDFRAFAADLARGSYIAKLLGKRKKPKGK